MQEVFDAKIPAKILAKHPEMIQISQALEQFRNKQEITTRCLKCGNVPMIEDLPEVGVTAVNCQCGKLSYRERYRPRKVV